MSISSAIRMTTTAGMGSVFEGREDGLLQDRRVDDNSPIAAVRVDHVVWQRHDGGVHTIVASLLLGPSRLFVCRGVHRAALFRAGFFFDSSSAVQSSHRSRSSSFCVQPLMWAISRVSSMLSYADSCPRLPHPSQYTTVPGTVMDSCLMLMGYLSVCALLSQLPSAVSLISARVFAPRGSCVNDPSAVRSSCLPTQPDQLY